jgi:hypothetical protein
MLSTEIPRPNARGLRQFAFTMGVMVAAIFGVVLPWTFEFLWPLWPWIVLAVSLIWGLLVPNSLWPVYLVWMYFGLLLSRVTTPVILTAVFFLAIFPASILLRLFRKDPLRRSFDSTSTYRVKSTTPSGKSMENPY